MYGKAWDVRHAWQGHSVYGTGWVDVGAVGRGLEDVERWTEMVHGGWCMAVEDGGGGTVDGGWWMVDGGSAVVSKTVSCRVV